MSESESPNSTRACQKCGAENSSVARFCVDCGEVQDVAVDPGIEARVGGLIESIAAEAGYRVIGHRFDIQGRCSACLAR